PANVVIVVDAGDILRRQLSCRRPGRHDKENDRSTMPYAVAMGHREFERRWAYGEDLIDPQARVFLLEQRCLLSFELRKAEEIERLADEIDGVRRRSRCDRLAQHRIERQPEGNEDVAAAQNYDAPR